MPTCAYCGKTIARSEPEMLDDQTFCNALCGVGYEAERVLCKEKEPAD
jgi:hypothetical protein